ncbi:flagellar hook-length control protein FliK [Arthrobacter sp. UYEF3]|uniref:flagellar hook-length control protein FliK n=1 Tax=Arthrobacter sp. UYEF3 TaxID=1756365 RepID=UPI003396FD04
MKGMASMDLASALAPAPARGARGALQDSRGRSEAGASKGFGTALNDAVSNEAASAAPRSKVPGSAASVRGEAGHSKKREAGAGTQATASASLPDGASAAATEAPATDAPAAHAGILAASAQFAAGIQPAPAAGPAATADPIQAPVALPAGAQAIGGSTQPLAGPRLALQATTTAVPTVGVTAVAALAVPDVPAAGQEPGTTAAAGSAAAPDGPLPGAVVFPTADGQAAGGQSFGGQGGRPATLPAPGPVSAVVQGQTPATSAGVQDPAAAAATVLPTVSAPTATPAPAGAAAAAIAGAVDQPGGLSCRATAAPADSLPVTAAPGVSGSVDGLAAAAVAGSAAAPPSAAPAQTAAAPQATAPAPQPALQPQLAKPLFTLAGAPHGQHIMTLKVTPEDLGPLTVRAHIDGAGVRIELFAPGDTGREALRGILPELRKELANSGFGASLDVSDHNGPPGRGQDRGQDPGQDPGQDTGRDGFQAGSGAGSGSDSRSGPGAPRPGHRWDALADEASLRTARILNGPSTTLDILV